VYPSSVVVARRPENEDYLASDPHTGKRPDSDKILVTTQILMKSSEVFFFIFEKACTITRYCGNLIVILGKL